MKIVMRSLLAIALLGLAAPSVRAEDPPAGDAKKDAKKDKKDKKDKKKDDKKDEAKGGGW